MTNLWKDIYNPVEPEKEPLFMTTPVFMDDMIDWSWGEPTSDMYVTRQGA